MDNSRYKPASSFILGYSEIRIYHLPSILFHISRACRLVAIWKVEIGNLELLLKMQAVFQCLPK